MNTKDEDNGRPEMGAASMRLTRNQANARSSKLRQRDAMITELYMPCATTEHCGKSVTPLVVGKGFHRFLTTYEPRITTRC